jgi:hypothetical protein
VRVRAYGNAEQLANAVAQQNPALEVGRMQYLFRGHLDHELAAVEAIFRNDWSSALAQRDAGADNDAMLADALSGPAEQDDADTQLHLAMRTLWSTQAQDVRLVVMLGTAKLSGVDVIAADALARQMDIAAAFRRDFGEAAADQLIELLQHRALLVSAVVAAAASHDPLAAEEAGRAWTANSNSIARVLTAISPLFVQSDVAVLLSEPYVLTREQATDRLVGQWAADAEAWDKLKVVTVQMADTLSRGIIEYRSGQFPPRVGARPGRTERPIELRGFSHTSL